MAGTKRLTMAIPGTAGQYAPEVLYCRMSDSRLDLVSLLTVLIESLPTSAQIEVELLKVNGDPDVSGDWLAPLVVADAVGLYNDLTFAEWKGVRLRGKSGGSAGNAIVDATWS